MYVGGLLSGKSRNGGTAHCTWIQLDVVVLDLRHLLNGNDGEYNLKEKRSRDSVLLNKFLVTEDRKSVV